MSAVRFQELAERRPTLVLINDNLIYVGHALDLTPHRIAVTTIAVAIEEPFELEMDGRSFPHCQTTAMIPAQTLHHLRARGKMAFVYTGRPLDGIANDILTPAAALAVRIADVPQDDISVLARASELLALFDITSGVPSSAVSVSLSRMASSPHDLRTAEQGAAVAGLNTQVFRRRVVKETGMTFGQHRRRTLVHGALRSLARGENLTGAAHQAGFSSSAHFSSTVRRMFGMQPSKLLRAGVRLVVDETQYGVN